MVQISVNTTEFNRAISNYMAATGKTFPAAINRQMANTAIKAHGKLKVAQRSKIDALQKEPWWPAFVMQTYKSRKLQNMVRKFRKTGKQHRKLVRLKGLKALSGGGYGIKGPAIKLKGGRSNKQLAALSRKIINSRQRAVQFLRGFIVIMAKKLKGGKQLGKQFKDIGSRVTLASKTNSKALAESNFTFKRSKKSSSFVERECLKAINRAIPETIRDMENYIRDNF